MSATPSAFAGGVVREQPVSPVYTRIAWRIIPLVMVCYLMAYLDRVNIGFAKLQMSADLRFSESAYGLGAGLFFLGYLLFEVPSNVLMMKIGAKRTICRIMFLWGVLSMGFAFVQTPTQFYVLRMLLGAAEAGFYPGIILYLTFWFPSKTRAKMTALFFTAVPLSGLIGAPLSGWILDSMNGIHGLRGWQWLFLIEGLPSVLLALAVPFVLSDSPRHVSWLTAEEKKMVVDELEEEARAKAENEAGRASLKEVFVKPQVWYLSLLCICQTMGVYGIGFWLPTLLRDLGFKSATQIGWIAVIPFACAAVTMILVSRSSDRHLERRWHTAVPFLCSATGLFASTLLVQHPVFAIAALTLATVGAYTTSAMFWSLPSMFFTGIGMAAAIGLINSLGGLGGFLSPYLLGVLKDVTGTTASGVYVITAVAIIGAILVLRLPKRIVSR